MAQYPMMSPYVAFNNNPIYFVDPLGLEGTDGVARTEIGDDGVKHEKWFWVDETYKNKEEALATGLYSNWMGKGGVIEDMHCSSGYVGPVTLMDNNNFFLGLVNNNQSEQGNLTPEEEAAFNPNQNIKIVSVQEFLRIKMNEESEERMRINASRQGMYNFCDFAQKMVFGTACVLASGGLLAEATIAYPAVFGTNTKFWYLKATISAGSQAIINKGDINVVGVIGDGFFGYGTSSLAQSSFNYKINLHSGNTEFTSVFHSGKNNISIQKFAFESSVGIVFGYKQNFVMKGYNKNFGAGRPSIKRNFGKEAFGSSLYTLPSNGINRCYEENHK